MANGRGWAVAVVCVVATGCELSGAVEHGPGKAEVSGDDEGRADFVMGPEGQDHQGFDGEVPAYADGGALPMPPPDGALVDADGGVVVEPPAPTPTDDMLVAVGERLVRTTYQDGAGVTTSFNRDPLEPWSKWYILRDVECGPGRCVAVGDGFAYVTTKPNEWVGQEHGMSWFGGVAYGDGWYIAAGGNLAISRSRDGLAWEPDRWQEIRALVGSRNEDSDHFRGIGYGNGRFVAVGEKTVAGSPYPIGLVVTSADQGATWVRATLPNGAGLQGVGHGPSGFVAVGYGGRRIRSTDGLHWDNDVADPALASLRGAIFADGKYIASGDNGFAISTTGAAGTWTQHLYPGQFSQARVAFVKGRFFVSSGGGALKSTTDFQTWKTEGQAAAGYWSIASGKL
jgi:hypothetical protein